MTTDDLLDAYRCMYAARSIDQVERNYIDRGLAFFSVSGAGHEASATLATYLSPGDWLHCHYRDKALMVARGLPYVEFFRALFCTEASSSGGRQMSAHLASPSLRLLSIPGPVGNNVLQDVGIAAAIKDRRDDHLVVSSLGEGTTQQGEVLEGFCEASRSQLPILFLIHDNRYAISVSTSGKTIFARAEDSILGIPTTYVDGSDPVACATAFQQAIGSIREKQGPHMVVMACERLCSHTNADDQSVYRDANEISASASGDPILHLKSDLLARGIDPPVLEEIESKTLTKIRSAVEKASQEASGQYIVPASGAPSVNERSPRKPIKLEERKELVFLGASINMVLDAALKTGEEVILYGQDIEDPKGDVFGVTKGLSTRYPNRVINAPLTEATIVGSCLGRAVAGQRPVAFIQFADFLPLTFNQIINELGTMSWRTKGKVTCPLLILVSAGAYRPGLGPFHAQSMETYLCHTPGIIVVSPSNAEDAAGLLLALLESPEPSVFLYPKNLLNDPQAARPLGPSVAPVPLGKARFDRRGSHITLVGWGNIIPLLQEVAEALRTIQLSAEIIDLRTLAPWDRESVLSSSAKTKCLLVAHEDNQTCGLAAEIIASAAETLGCEELLTGRVCRADTPIPCHYPSQLQTLPSTASILEKACEMLQIDLKWERAEPLPDDLFELRAAGTSPADDQLVLLDWQVKEGDRIREGDLLLEIEADKAAFEFRSPVSGLLVRIIAPSSSRCSVGDCLAKIALDEGRSTGLPPNATQAKQIPKLTQPLSATVSRPSKGPPAGSSIFKLVTGVGDRRIDNDMIGRQADMKAAEILQSTGIETRYWYTDNQILESAVVTALDDLIRETPDIAARLGMVLLSTGTNSQSMPSRACRILERLAAKHDLNNPGAYDFYTACSGYIYGLEQADGYLHLNPDRLVILITAEHLSGYLDKADRNTAALFGDGFSVSLIGKRENLDLGKPLLDIVSTCCFSKPDPTDSLTLSEGKSIEMDGSEVFMNASRSMPEALQRACEKAKMNISDLEVVIPHQANQRIIDAVGRRLKKHKVAVFSNVRSYGNTSSTTIPLGLKDYLAGIDAEQEIQIGLTAFGGGYTYGAAVLKLASGSSD